MIKTNFFPDGATIYTAADFIRPKSNLLSNGVYASTDFAVSADSPADLGVTVAGGNAVINGYDIYSDAPDSVAIPPNTSGYNRIDLIVINVDPINKVTTIQDVQGVASSSPVAPVVGSNQLALAQVLVGNGASAINSNVITDARARSNIKFLSLGLGSANPDQVDNAYYALLAGSASAAVAGSALALSQGNYKNHAFISANTTLTDADSGSFIESTAAVTATLPTPANKRGEIFKFWANGNALTFSTPAGAFYGRGVTGGPTSFSVPSNTVVELVSDGANWIVTYTSYYPKTTVTPTMAGGWTIYNAAFSPMSYYLDPITGRVEVMGMIMSGSLNTTIFTFPAGYRPATNKNYAVITSSGIGRVQIGSAGDVQIISGGTGFVSFDGISFLAEQ